MFKKCSRHGFNEFLSKLDRENRDVVTQNEFQVRDIRTFLDIKRLTVSVLQSL